MWSRETTVRETRCEFFSVFEGGKPIFSAGLLPGTVGGWFCLFQDFCSSNTEVGCHGNGSLLRDNNNVIVDFHCHWVGPFSVCSWKTTCHECVIWILPSLMLFPKGGEEMTERCNQGNIFLVLHCLVILVQSLDFILVMRWNKQMGLPDFLFFLGDEILGKRLNCWGFCFFGFDLFCCCGFTLQFSYLVICLFCFGFSLALTGLALFDMCFPYIVARSLFSVST